MYFTTIFVPTKLSTSYAPFIKQLTAMEKNEKRHWTEIKIVQA